MRRARSAPTSTFGSMPVRNPVTPHRRSVESVAATVARRCTRREPISMASAAAATVTVEPVSSGAVRDSDTHSSVAAGRGADVPDIPEIVSEQSGAVVRDGMPGTLLSESRCRMSLRTTEASPPLWTLSMREPISRPKSPAGARPGHFPGDCRGSRNGVTNAGAKIRQPVPLQAMGNAGSCSTQLPR